LPYLSGVNSYPYLYSHFNLGYLNPQISEVDRGLVNRVNLHLVSHVCLQDSEEKDEDTHEVQVQSTQVQDQDREDSFMDLAWSMIFEEIKEAKKQRDDELLLIERKKHELDEQKRQIDYERCDLESREEKYRDIIPLARQFVQSQIGFHEVLAFHTAVYECREAYGLGSLREASWKLARDLRFYRRIVMAS
jgi:hypothetical protein